MRARWWSASRATRPAYRAKVWFGRPWQGSTEHSASLPASANNYFSLAVFRPDEAGQYRRQKARFHALHAVMLDDVGTKVAMERLTLPPSWLLETSPGNHQAGYLLREPLTDGAAADRLMNAIVAAGLCDPGANGPRARLARLPVAVNGKHTPPFQCRMVEWSPELRYSVDELVDGLQLEMASAGRPKRQSTRAAQERPVTAIRSGYLAPRKTPCWSRCGTVACTRRRWAMASTTSPAPG